MCNFLLLTWQCTINSTRLNFLKRRGAKIRHNYLKMQFIFTIMIMFIWGFDDQYIALKNNGNSFFIIPFCQNFKYFLVYPLVKLCTLHTNFKKRSISINNLFLAPSIFPLSLWSNYVFLCMFNLSLKTSIKEFVHILKSSIK